MKVGDKFGKLTVAEVEYRQRKDGAQGGPLLVDVRCVCGVEKRVLPAALTRTRCPSRSCGKKGCRVRRPKPKREVWVCKRRGTPDNIRGFRAF